jgi:class 3 adenylate cyclase
VGLSSGEVVVCLISDDLHLDYTAMGPTVHLASRLEQVAREGTCLLSAETLRLVEVTYRSAQSGRSRSRGWIDPSSCSNWWEPARHGRACRHWQPAA